MEEARYDAEKAKAFIVGKFVEQGDFMLFGEKVITDMTASVMALDEAFIRETDADGAGFYDDDAAFDYMLGRMQQSFPEHKMYMMRFVEDYMDYNEQYLDSLGVIEWE